MNNPGAQSAAGGRKLSPAVQQGVDESTARASCARVDGHASGLIHNEDVSILVEDFEGNVFRLSGKRGTRTDLDFDHLARTDAMRGRSSAPVHERKALLGHPLHARPPALPAPDA